LQMARFGPHIESRHSPAEQVPEWTEERLSALYGKALLIRKVEERLLELFAQGKLFGTVHTCIGQEFTGIAVAEALVEGDLIFSNHRCHGHFLARTGDVEGLIAEIMGKQTGVCGGRGGSQHLHSKGFFSNGVQGGIAPVSAGLAMAEKLRGSENIAVVFLGDGTLGEGVLYETLNIASKWDLPLFFVLENNGYAQSTPQWQTLAGSICGRAEAFGIKTCQTNTWDPLSLIAAVKDCVGYVRQDSRPLFLQVDTYRLMAHSKGDDDRSRAEVDNYWEKDPIKLYFQQTSDQTEKTLAAVTSVVDAAVAKADETPFADLADRESSFPAEKVPAWSPTRIETSDRMVKLLNAALRRNMERNERIILIGEDIEGPYGGAFKVTGDLSERFPGRVFNTPISEAALVGVGNGMALNGMIPVVEIMFGDFLSLAADQLINHASKFGFMYNDKIQVPLIVRTPMGGKRGYGPTHSQSLEKHFLGLPGTKMLAIHHRFDPGIIYDRLFETIDRPVLFIENKLLYALKVQDSLEEGFVLEHSDDLFPTTRIRPEGRPDATILCYGGMLPDVEAALYRLFDEHEVICEVICPTQLYPFDPRPVIESVASSNRLLVVEEGIGFAAFGAEAAAQIQELAPGVMQRLGRLASPNHPIPSSGPLEKEVLPGRDHVADAVLKLIRG
jgi:2-oxoisovalerate dehydrogenase E1 component